MQGFNTWFDDLEFKMKNKDFEKKGRHAKSSKPLSKPC